MVDLMKRVCSVKQLVASTITVTVVSTIFCYANYSYVQNEHQPVDVVFTFLKDCFLHNKWQLIKLAGYILVHDHNVYS